MPPPQKQQPSRINTAELRAQIEKKLGHERANKYFMQLTLFLSQRLSKPEFEKACRSTFGAENIGLHNQLIKAILKNAWQGKVPPPPSPAPASQDTSKPVKGVRRKVPVLVPVCNNNSPAVSTGNEDGSSPAWSNGDAFPLSPRKWRSRKGRDRPSPLGPHGKTDVTAPPSALGNEVAVKTSENGDVNSCDLYRPLHHPSGAAEQHEAEFNNIALPPLKRPRTKVTAIEAVTVEDGEEIEQVDADDKSTIWLEKPLQGPLGVPFCPASIGAARRALHSSPISYLTPASGSQQESCDSDEMLPDAETLQRKMEQRAVSDGFQSVSLNAAKLLVHGLDTVIKNLIRSSIDLKRARSCHEQDKLGIRSCYEQNKPGLSKQNSCKLGQGVNGVWPAHSMQVQSGGPMMDAARKARSHHPISLLDFKVAMELNTQQLGEDWPLQLEKISFRVAEEE